MRIEPEYQQGFETGVKFGAVIMFVIIMLIALIVSSCATYPLQSKVITPRSEAKANFR